MKQNDSFFATLRQALCLPGSKDASFRPSSAFPDADVLEYPKSSAPDIPYDDDDEWDDDDDDDD